MDQTYPHDTPSGYRRGCQCDACRTERSRYARERKRAIRAGTWEPQPRKRMVKPCSGPDCERPAVYANPPLCGAHRAQVKRGAELTPIRDSSPVQCAGPECDRLARHRSPQPLCESHYQQVHVRKVPLAPVQRRRLVVDGMKQCTRCDVLLPLAAFHRKQGDTVNSACKECVSIINRMNKYGLSFDETKALMLNACATCGSADRLHVDHCHDTGKVRGVLCHNCNTVLTKHMTPTVLRNLADYLERA